MGFGRDAMRYLNKIRIKNGLKPLEFDERAYRLAKFRAKDMVRRNYFAHVDLDALRERFGFNNEVLAECIYMGDTSKPTKPINAWLRSKKGHREIILSSSLTHGAIYRCKNKVVFIGVKMNIVDKILYIIKKPLLNNKGSAYAWLTFFVFMWVFSIVWFFAVDPLFTSAIETAENSGYVNLLGGDVLYGFYKALYPIFPFLMFFFAVIGFLKYASTTKKRWDE